MALPRLQLALLVVAAVAIAFLNPWLLLFAAVGYVGGWVIRALLHALSPARAQVRTLARIIGVVLAPIASIVGLVLTFGPDLRPGGDGGPQARRTWTAPYRAQLVYAHGVLRVREQFKLPSRLRVKPGFVGSETALADSRWSKVKLVDGQLVIEHRRPEIVPHIRKWPLRTSVHVSLTSYELNGGDLIVPAEGSTADITGPRDLVASTDPSTTATTELPGNLERRRITLLDSGSFDEIDAITFQANSALARNPVVRPLLGASLWTPLLGITAIATAILKDWLTDRIKRLLRLKKHAAPDAPARAPA
ncbi:MAG TPA: hypothetical protein VGJ77_18860 [Gaiellaceae bacterium]